MIVVYEFFYKPFDAHGDNDYLHEWASEIDDLAARGWTVLDCVRQVRHPGFWTTVLCRPERAFKSESAE